MKKSISSSLAVFMIIILPLACSCKRNRDEIKASVNNELDSFLIQTKDLDLSFHYPDPERLLSYSNYSGEFKEWKEEVLHKFTELTGYSPPEKRSVTSLRSKHIENITYHALIMKVSENLSIPAYVLVPDKQTKGAVMTIHGHGSVEPTIGLVDDYHHKFAYELAKEGYLVIAPELRGFNTLGDLAWQEPIDRLDYWNTHGQFSLVTDGFLHGETLIGETIEDLKAWEEWFVDNYNVNTFDVAGISYGGDLALFYPVFSSRVRKIFSSGSLGSFNLIFSRCYNAPAHCIPNILKWMDRSDIAGLNVPRPIMLHYGELDTPSETNHSASFNESVESSVAELKTIYAEMESENLIQLYVTPNSRHEMDIKALLSFLR